MDDLCELLKSVRELAFAAGREILAVYERDYAVVHKNDKTPLTEADLAAHHVIDDGLEELTPDIPILSEESAKVPFEERATWQRYWLVDPLDGTREFIKRNGEFTVNIALIDNHRPILGVVHAPVLLVDYFACQGHGAYKHVGDEAPQRIHTRPWDGGRVTIAGSRSHRSQAFNDFVGKLGEYEIISMGSSLKSCLVAEGKAHLYVRLGPTSEWDTAAAQCVVEEAGGRITDTDMQVLRYNTKDSLLNPHFFVCGDADQDWSRFL
jgi:3'(2'), 5'-bisphosphate nucleotidase